MLCVPTLPSLQNLQRAALQSAVRLQLLCVMNLRYIFLHQLHLGVGRVCAHYAGLLATASWDGKLCYWDPRSPAHAGPVLAVTLPGKAYSLTATNSHAIVGTSGRHLVIFNINQ